MLQKICNITCVKKKSTFITDLIKKFLVKIPLILLLKSGFSVEKLVEERLQFVFFITKSNAFLFFYRKNNAFFVTWNKIYAKFVQNVTKFVVKVPKKKVVWQPACPPQTPLLSTSHDRAWLPRFHYGSPCPWINKNAALFIKLRTWDLCTITHQICDKNY